MRETRFKKLNDDCRILGIGSLFRAKGRKSWAINVDFNGQQSQSMQFSNIPILARKRVLNPTTRYKLAGLQKSFSIENAQKWNVAKAADCPAYQAHRHGRDGNQLCFVFQDARTRVFIPQLEMARALFYHDPFLARLSLQHNALAEDFILTNNNDGRPMIVVREGAEYPMYYFNRDDNRRFLSWVLLDPKARASFESISVNLIKNQYQKNNYLHWNFQFIPPSLSDVEVVASGWEDKKTNSFYVWEITKLKNLPSSLRGEIDFYHPDYEPKVGGKPIEGSGHHWEVPDDYELDDELSSVDKATMTLLSEQVVVSFKTPHITNRIASKTKSVSNSSGDSDDITLSETLSPNEKEDTGSLTGGSWNNLNDQTDDTYLYIGKFESFFNMVDSLVGTYGCILLTKNLSKLPQVGAGKKHRLYDTSNPRCLATVVLKYDKGFYTLLEVDTSDGAAKLSTILLKSSPEWAIENRATVLKQIMKQSLCWPRDYFQDSLGENTFVGIPHPKSKHLGSLPPEVIKPWAQRVANWIERSK